MKKKILILCLGTLFLLPLFLGCETLCKERRTHDYWKKSKDAVVRADQWVRENLW